MQKLIVVASMVILTGCVGPSVSVDNLRKRSSTNTLIWDGLNDKWIVDSNTSPSATVLDKDGINTTGPGPGRSMIFTRDGRVQLDGEEVAELPADLSVGLFDPLNGTLKDLRIETRPDGTTIIQLGELASDAAATIAAHDAQVIAILEAQGKLTEEQAETARTLISEGFGLAEALARALATPTP